MNPDFFIKILLVILVLLVATSSLGAEQATLPTATRLAEAQNRFATDLYAQLRERQGNLFFSPESIATAMTMTYIGAKEETAVEMANVLHIMDLRPENQDAALPLRTLVLERYAEQVKLFSEQQENGLELHTANALWVKANYPLNLNFVKDVKDSFSATLEPVDFRNEPAARNRINDWVADQTSSKIQNLIAPGLLNPDTRLVLTNAIYFKAAWEEQFRKGNTKTERFHVSSVKDVDVEMMKQTHFYSLAELEGFRLLNITYEKNQASLLVLLPNEVDGLAALEGSITSEKLALWIEKTKSVSVALSLPKFKLSSKFELNSALRALGMKKAFMAGQANFTGIASVPGEPLYIGLVIHQAFVDVKEEGTEAAAATAVIAPTAAPRPAEPVSFVADRPFVYIIRNNRTGSILFMGRLADPSRG
jgi:serpin B